MAATVQERTLPWPANTAMSLADSSLLWHLVQGAGREAGRPAERMLPAPTSAKTQARQQESRQARDEGVRRTTAVRGGPTTVRTLSSSPMPFAHVAPKHAAASALAALHRVRKRVEADPHLSPLVTQLTDSEWLALVVLAYLPQAQQGPQFLFGGGGLGGWGFAWWSYYLKKLQCAVTCSFGCSDSCGCPCKPAPGPGPGGSSAGAGQKGVGSDDDMGAVGIGPSAAETGAENPTPKVPGCTKWLYDKCAPEGCPGSAAWVGAWNELQNNGCPYGASPGAICYDEYGKGWSSPGVPVSAMCSCVVGCYKNGVKVKPKGK